ncbi:MAG: hypothetical protein M3Z24_13075 [Chloroflexota bacterium]|nr:hypothetical protein [Chloroflexota bacterium]
MQAHQQQRYGVALTFLDDWQNQIHHLLAQEEASPRPLSEALRQALVQQSI